jgi:hypothetical protein
MSAPVFLTTIITITAANLGIVLAIVWYFGTQIGRLDRRIDRLDEHVQLLREDVAVLKATSSG